MTSVAFELAQPAAADVGLAVAMAGLGAAAVVFTAVDHLIDEAWARDDGLGNLAAVTLDDIPDNLALGVALIGAGRDPVGGHRDRAAHLAGHPRYAVGAIEAFVAGTVLASLATEVVPEAFQQARHDAGVAITAGFAMTFLLTV